MGKKRAYSARVWHVMARGVEGRSIFLDDQDRELFLDRVERYSAKVGVAVNTFCLMTNHYHLLLTAPQFVITEFMTRLNWKYVYEFNKRNQRVGPLFQGRFHSVPLWRPTRILETSCYVNQNAATANMIRDSRDYKWSSCRYYLPEFRASAPSWLDLGTIADAMGAMGITSWDRYARLMKTYRGDERDSWIRDLVHEAEQLEDGRVEAHLREKTEP